MNELIDVPLSMIKPNPYQPATRENEIDELAASIDAIGMITPVTLLFVKEEEYIIVSGHKRIEALTRLGCANARAEVMHNDLNDPNEMAHMLKAFAATNTARRDFTVAEKAEVYQTMLDLGISEADIETATGDHSTAMLTKVGKGLIIAKKHLDTDDLTLDQLWALTEFEDDPSATDDLIAAIEDDNFERVVRQLRFDRYLQLDMDAAKAALEADGVRLIPTNTTPIVVLEKLGISEANHRSCDGHCAIVRSTWDGEVMTVFCCDQPKLHKYKEPKPEKSKMQLEEDEKTRAGREFKKEGLVDYSIRHDLVKVILNEADPTKLKGVFPWLAYATAHRVGTVSKDTYDLLGKRVPLADNRYGDKDKDGNIKQEFVGKAADFCPKNAPAAIKAMIAMTTADVNEELRLAQDASGYRTQHVVPYYAFLKANGYKMGVHDDKFLAAKVEKQDTKDDA